MRTHTWEISDELWSFAESCLPKSRRDPAKKYLRKPGGGRKVTYGDRLYFSAMVYILRTGLIWNALPREKFNGLGSSALHTRFQEWTKTGFFETLWRKGLAEYDEMEGISWKWQSSDGTNVEAPLAWESVGANPTDRGKKWKQASLSRRRKWRPAVDSRKRSKRPRQ
jgi:transposase